MEQASDAGQAEGLTSASVDISTNFTIGQAVKDGAAELKTFIGTQLPCADVTLEDATLTVVYGAKAGNCAYRVHTFSGTHTISLERNDDATNLLAEHLAPLSLRVRTTSRDFR